MALFYLLVTLLLVFGYEVKAARILALIPLGTKSHTSGFQPLYHELAKRGHRVTIVTNYVPPKPIPNVRYIQNFDSKELQSIFENPFHMRLRGDTLNLFGVTHIYEFVCKRSYENPEVTKLLEEDFDLVIINSFMSECIYGLASEFKNAKLVYFSTLPLLSFISSGFGNPVTPSVTPLFTRGFSDKMTLYQRIQNFIQTMHYYFLRNYYHIPRMEAVYKSFIPSAPSVAEIEERVDLILINSHPIINYPRALLPNMIETSGLQLKDGEKLPPDLQEFIDGAGDDGFIYFSFGSFIQGSELPVQYRLAFLRVFAKLKQRVIWKFETEEIETLPPNVKLGKWLPQQDILAQPSIRLFITHGGLLSLQEAVYHGVPLLGIPLFGDQDGNLEQAFQRGFSLTLNVEDISEELITEKLTKILENDSFKTNARKVSESFRDRPTPPLETAIHWTEYLLRHNDTSHLQSAGRHLNSIQYHLVDVITMLAVILWAIVYVLVKIMKLTYRIFSMLFTRYSNATSKRMKHSGQEFWYFRLNLGIHDFQIAELRSLFRSNTMSEQGDWMRTALEKQRIHAEQQQRSLAATEASPIPITPHEFQRLKTSAKLSALHDKELEGLVKVMDASKLREEQLAKLFLARPIAFRKKVKLPPTTRVYEELPFLRNLKSRALA